jgi:murein L,D-transpeptidase YafK
MCFTSNARAEQNLQMADRVVVYKSQRILKLIANDKVIKEYSVSLGRNPIGHKQQQGDSRTPEGRYTLDYRNPHSRFYRSLHISYPNKEDRTRAQRQGVNPGGDIFLHGQPNGSAASSTWIKHDWTDGCIAVSNDAMNDIWLRLRNGTEIIIHP